mmetsp:Transcript_43338/g.94862  ORF Transcript_43338/g.94862 Transcript_43338/m.94862 type:complete len:102 (+) Transcript_43338:908-1213(+)
MAPRAVEAVMVVAAAGGVKMPLGWVALMKVQGASCLLRRRRWLAGRRIRRTLKGLTQVAAARVQAALAAAAVAAMVKAVKAKGVETMGSERLNQLRMMMAV